VVPIAQSTTFKYDTAQEIAQWFNLSAGGFAYTRLANPTVAAVAAKLTALEGGVGGVLTASGQSASLMSILNICKSGDHVVCSASLYGGTYNLFNKTMRDMGIDFTFIHPDESYEKICESFKENTKLVFTETLSNPNLVVLDIGKWSRAAHAHGVPHITDNTFPTPINCRPFEHGADIVVHSTTKYLDGHACSLGGAIIDSGNFDWNAHSDKFPGLTEPEETYHGLVYTENFGKAAYAIKLTAHMLRDLGATMSPQNAFLLNLGLETLFLRMERHCQNALQVAKYLEKHDKVSWVNFPGLENNPYYKLANQYMPGGTCGVVAFGVKGGREAGVKVMEAMKLAAIVVHVADARTCVLHPASTTHRQLSDQALADAGIGVDLLRMSIGIEHADDIIADIEQALAQV